MRLEDKNIRGIKKGLKKEVKIEEIVKILESDERLGYAPVVSYVANLTKDPFKILISCILSLRTKDKTTSEACRRLFKEADNAEDMLKLGEDRISELIYPVGFYKTKAKRIVEISGILISEYGNRVPDELEELMKLPGVGRKTANLVITEAYNKDGICVDTHVHRIMNRLGYVKSKKPEETEFELRRKLPLRYWKIINTLLVKLGQTICLPVKPLCNRCKIINYCNQIFVNRKG